LEETWLLDDEKNIDVIHADQLTYSNLDLLVDLRVDSLQRASASSMMSFKKITSPFLVLIPFILPKETWWRFL